MNRLEKEKIYLNTQVKQLNSEYNAIVNVYELVSKTIYDEVINIPEITSIFKDAKDSTKNQKELIRQRLYQKLIDTYSNLKSKNLKQLHFHLPDGESFLRFHRPNRHSDKLFNVRYSLKIANQKLTPVKGFEEGRIYNGFRYVFPLFYEGEHIGSVETSVSFNAIKDELSKLFKNEYNFLISKETVDAKVFKDEKDNYIVSDISKSFLYELKALNSNRYDNINYQKIKEINSILRDNLSVKKSLKSGESFSKIVDLKSDRYIITFISITNVKGDRVAYIISYLKDDMSTHYQLQFLKSLTGITLLIIILIVLFDLNRTKIRVLRELNRNKLTLEKTSKELEIKNEKLIAIQNRFTDSINFSSLIQKSTLPNPNSLNRYFDDSMILWEPKDIVGGDIYEIVEFEDGVLILIADCTGHGVAGALMSMVAKTLFDSIIDKSNYSDPAKILKILNLNIKKSLKQDRDETLNDTGLDGGVIFYDKLKNQVTFAGANTRLFYIQKSHLHTIKGDRVSIGYKRSNSNFEFKNHTIDIESDSRFYICSDGYSDQLGGDRNFPFGFKRFKELILKNFKLNFKSQKTLFREALLKYQDREDRCDDITIVGFLIKEKF